MRVAVIGAGIGGLAAAFDLTRAGADVVVIDASDRPGGKLRTSLFAGMPLDESADTFLARVPWGVELCRDLGLDAELISPSTGSALVAHDGRLHRLPEGLVLGVPTDLDALRASGLLSEAGLARVAADLARTAGPAPPGTPAAAAPADVGGGDVAVGPLVRARLGDEAFEVLVDPLLSGINAGRADELSAELGAAQLLAAARRDPSLVRGARAVAPPASEPGRPRPPAFHAIPGGMVRLVDALVDAIGVDRFRLGTAVDALTVDAARPAEGSGAYVVTSAGASELVDAAVVAIPAPAAAALLRALVPEVADGLAELRYASVALVALAYRRDDVPGALDASGFLVPRQEGMLLTACSWSSSKFAHLGADGVVRLRASVGRSDDRRFLELADDELVTAIRAELGALMGIEAAPTEVRVARWLDALPQYRPGHAERVEGWQAGLRRAAPGIELAGAALRGLGLPACINSGRQAAAALLRRGGGTGARAGRASGESPG